MRNLGQLSYTNTTSIASLSFEWMLILAPFLVLVFWIHPKQARWGRVPKYLYWSAGSLILLVSALQIYIVASVRLAQFNEELLQQLVSFWKYPMYGLYLAAFILYIITYFTRRQEKKDDCAL